MASFKKRDDANRKKEAINLLKAFAEKIKNGEVEVETVGWWTATEGKLNLKLVVKESENNRTLSNY